VVGAVAFANTITLAAVVPATVTPTSKLPELSIRMRSTGVVALDVVSTKAPFKSPDVLFSLIAEMEAHVAGVPNVVLATRNAIPDPLPAAIAVLSSITHVTGAVAAV
jgi:hypothetical protein